MTMLHWSRLFTARIESESGVSEHAQGQKDMLFDDIVAPPAHPHALRLGKRDLLAPIPAGSGRWSRCKARGPCAAQALPLGGPAPCQPHNHPLCSLLTALLRNLYLYSFAGHPAPAAL